MNRLVERIVGMDALPFAGLAPSKGSMVLLFGRGPLKAFEAPGLSPRRPR
jgi:hypothetical protein